ncbi:hypothetical protein T261_2882 [Streptomyces lydicus]|nr:hypothetical protein T261_2882 [Streptomyces lydicus]
MTGGGLLGHDGGAFRSRMHPHEAAGRARDRARPPPADT